MLAERYLQHQADSPYQNLCSSLLMLVGDTLQGRIVGFTVAPDGAVCLDNHLLRVTPGYSFVLLAPGM